MIIISVDNNATSNIHKIVIHMQSRQWNLVRTFYSFNFNCTSNNFIFSSKSVNRYEPRFEKWVLGERNSKYPDQTAKSHYLTIVFSKH